jgi:hypothetical protein
LRGRGPVLPESAAAAALGAAGWSSFTSVNCALCTMKVVS